jgi:hypothetical protein
MFFFPFGLTRYIPPPNLLFSLVAFDSFQLFLMALIPSIRSSSLFISPDPAATKSSIDREMASLTYQDPLDFQLSTMASDLSPA